MSKPIALLAATLALALQPTAQAQQAQTPVQAFPADATSPGADEIKAWLNGKVLSVALADGSSWRLEYKDNGFFFVDTNAGFRSSGNWSAEAGKLCGQLKGRDRSCNEVRMHQGQLHYRRDTGEVLRFVPR